MYIHCINMYMYCMLIINFNRYSPVKFPWSVWIKYKYLMTGRTAERKEKNYA